MPHVKLTRFFIFLLPLMIVLLSQQPLHAQTRQQYELNSITFTGNTKVSSGSLEQVIYTVETPMWLWKFINSFSGFGAPPVYFDSTTIQYDLRALSDYYTSNGFFQAEFKYSYTVDSVEKEVNLNYEISEGTQSKYGEIEFFGLPKDDPVLISEALKGFAPDSTQFFNQSIIKTGIDNITVFFENSGFMLARFDSTIILRDTVASRAHLQIYLSLGKKYTISGVSVEKKGEGSDAVESDMIIRLVGIKSGETYNLERIRLSQVRLYRTGLFSSVALNPLFSDTVNSTVPLMISGTIGNIHELSPEILMNNQSNTFNVGLGGIFVKKNFLGDARKLSISGSAGYRDIFRTNFGRMFKTFSLQDTTIRGYVDAVFRIEQPYIFNRPILGTFETYFRVNKEDNSNKRNYGGKISLEFELPRYTFINFITSYYNLEVADELFPAQSGLKQLNKTLSILGADLRSSHVDNPLFPTKGYNFSFLVEEANLLDYGVTSLFGHEYNGSLFYKTAITGAYYFSLNRNLTSVLGVKLKTGHLQAYMGDDAGIATTRRFTAGGSNSIRGWAARQLAPAEVRLLDGEQVIVQGGNFILEGSVEIRQKVFGDFGYAAFVDYGNVWKNHSKFNIPEIAVAGGVGLRYYSPFAPFRIDFGFKLYDPYDTRPMGKKKFFGELMEYHFGIGEAF